MSEGGKIDEFFIPAKCQFVVAEMFYFPLISVMQAFPTNWEWWIAFCKFSWCRALLLLALNTKMV